MRACPLVCPLAWSAVRVVPQCSGLNRAIVPTNNYPLGSSCQGGWLPVAWSHPAGGVVARQVSVGRLGVARSCPLACPLGWPPGAAAPLSLLQPLPTNVGVRWQAVSCPLGGGL
jgi:hypothetical protein